MSRVLRSPRPRAWLPLLGCTFLALAGAHAAAQSTPHSTTLSYAFDSGPVANTGTRPEVVISFPVHVQGAKWMRLHFQHVQLAGSVFAGNGATLRMTSTWDAEVQEMSAVNVRQWQQTSAYFNGDTVLVEVLAQPGTAINHVILESVTVDLTGAPESICGPTDDRIPSNDARVGRLVPLSCTAFLVENNCGACYLSAVDCAQSQTVVQFNVPPSDPTGSITHPPVQDQYAVDPASIYNQGLKTTTNFSSFGTFPNPNTGLTARQAQSAGFQIVTPSLAPNDNLRVTGYGADPTTPADNRVQQTHSGPGYGNFCAIFHMIDTEDGSAGSPIVHDATGDLVGLHNSDGCNQPPGQNMGSWISGFCGPEEAIMNPIGICKSGFSDPGAMPTTLVANASTTITVALNGANQFGSAMFHYRLQGGTFTSRPLTPIGGELYQATLPPALCTDSPEWYFSVVNLDCGVLTLPENAPTSGTFTATVAAVPATIYCTAKSGLTCATPAIATLGTPSLSSGSFWIIAGPARQNSTGLILYTNAGPKIQPFQGGFLCINTISMRRGPATSANGFSPCDGRFFIDMTAFAAGSIGGNPAPFLSAAGTIVNAQWWGRDSTTTGSFLSDAVQYTVCP